MDFDYGTEEYNSNTEYTSDYENQTNINNSKGENNMENNMVYTPEAHIAITEVYAENGVVYLKFKKPKTQIYEVMTLDMFLSMVYQTLERKYYDESY